MMRPMGYIYSGSLTYPDHGRGYFGADPEPATRQTGGGGLILFPFRNVTGDRESTLPSEHLEALR